MSINIFQNKSRYARVPIIESSKYYSTLNVNNNLILSNNIIGNYSAWKNPARVATTANIDILQGLLEIDGVTLNSGDRVLVKDQTNQIENGIYVASGKDWKRSQDFEAGTAQNGAMIYVQEGTVSGNKYFASLVGNSVIGYDNITFTSFEGNILTGFGINGSIFVQNPLSSLIAYDSFVFNETDTDTTLTISSNSTSSISATNDFVITTGNGTNSSGSLTLDSQTVSTTNNVNSEITISSPGNIDLINYSINDYIFNEGTRTGSETADSGIIINGNTTITSNTGYPITFSGSSISFTKDEVVYNGTFNTQSRQGSITITDTTVINPNSFIQLSYSNGNYINSDTNVVFGNLVNYSGSAKPVVSVSCSGTTVFFNIINSDTLNNLTISDITIGFVII